MLVPKGSLLLSCYALISLFLPLPAGGIHIFIHFLSLRPLCGWNSSSPSLVLYITLETVRLLSGAAIKT